MRTSFFLRHINTLDIDDGERRAMMRWCQREGVCKQVWYNIEPPPPVNPPQLFFFSYLA
jgi:hypothetical protein